ncbi:MCE family protein [Thermosulfurimonas marina]|uniref:MCE family protein n=1 Tax=Thermosulfurimonas marina TaxID=2047767 RepID=A0A6H1WU26_9BACT|nr:MlaD family protein [Thermosulfurimonas marina]QJA06654.1 MCE family protein [Thermosulfurimonas marina]
MYKKSTEIKVGIFVVAALAVLAYLTVKLAEESFHPQGTYPLYAVFENVSGLVRGARVEMAGVEIGRVGRIELLPEGKARVELLIYKGVKIAADAEAVVRTAGVLGDRFVEIRQGRAREVLSPGREIARTESPVDLGQVLAEVGPAVKELRQAAEGLSEILGSEEGRRNLKELIANLRDASASIKQAADRINRGEGTLGKLLTDEELYREIKSSFGDFKVTMANLREVSERMRRGEGTLGKLLTDEELYRSFRQAMDSVEKGSTAIAEVAEKINRGEGTLGKLLTDEELYSELEDAVRTLNRIVKKVDRGQGTLGKLVNDDSLYVEAKRALQNVNRATSGLQEQVPISVLGTIAGAAMH